jgi:ABC-type nitrate/sulfonate/bicarbonate transport system substrate-binding protein
MVLVMGKGKPAMTMRGSAPVISSGASNPSRKRIRRLDRSHRFGMTKCEFTRPTLLLVLRLVAIAFLCCSSTNYAHAALRIEKLRIAYPAVAPGSTPSWVTAENKIWQKYGLDVEPILVSGGARSVPALIGQSVQFLIGSDTGVTTAQLQGIPIVRLGVTMNTLGSSLLTQSSIQSIHELKGKILGISRGRDASYVRLAKLLRDNGLNPNEDVKFLQIGGGEAGRLSALKAGVIHGTMLFPPLDLIGKNEGLKILQKFDVPTPGGGINTTAALLRQSRALILNFLKGYMEGIRYMSTHKSESLQVLQKYFQNSDAATMGYLYDETTRRLEKELRANPESIRFHYDMAALDDPRAAKFSEKEFWDPSVVDEIRRSGFIDQLYQK